MVENSGKNTSYEGCIDSIQWYAVNEGGGGGGGGGRKSKDRGEAQKEITSQWP